MAFSSRWSISAAAFRRATLEPVSNAYAGASIIRSPSISAMQFLRPSSNRAAAWSAMPGRSRRRSCWKKKHKDDTQRWVYLDIGKFGGLAETMEEAIRYPIHTARDGDEKGPCVIADNLGVRREDALRPAVDAHGGRRGADRQMRSLYDDLRNGRLQALAARELRDLILRGSPLARRVREMRAPASTFPYPEERRDSGASKGPWRPRDGHHHS